MNPWFNIYSVLSWIEFFKGFEEIILFAGPQHIRSTMYTVPDTPDMKKQTGVPFGLVISPLADTQDGEYPPPIVNLGELGRIPIFMDFSWEKTFNAPFKGGGPRVRGRARNVLLSGKLNSV